MFEEERRTERVGGGAERRKQPPIGRFALVQSRRYGDQYTEPKCAPPRRKHPRPAIDPRFLDQQKKLTAWLRIAIRNGGVGARFEGGYPRYVWYKEDERPSTRHASSTRDGERTRAIPLKPMSGRAELRTFTADLTFDIEWIEPESTEIREFGATWAALRILVDERCVTRFYDRQNNSVRKTLILPLYPLAEWIAGNWWSLLYETVTPGRNPEGYPHRHNIRYGREGFALPDLSVRACGRVRFGGMDGHRPRALRRRVFGQGPGMDRPVRRRI